MNRFLKDNEHVIRIATNLILGAAFISFLTFSVMSVLERNKQHDARMIELNQEREKQRELRIKSELVYDEMLDYFEELKQISK